MSAIGVAFAWQMPGILLIALMLFFTGTFLGGTIPTLMGLPVQLESIGPVYAGTAGGVIGTIQIFGAVLIPSYVISPIAGGNFSMIFLLGGICMAVTSVISVFVKGIQ